MTKSTSPHIKQVLFKIEVLPDIHFFPAIIQIVETLYPKSFEHWRIESQIRCSLFSRKSKSSCIFEAGELLFIFNTTDEAQMLTLVQQCLDVYKKYVKFDSCIRIGLRHHDFNAVDMGTAELADLIASRYYTKEAFFAETFSKKMKDVAVILDFEKDKFKYHFKLGPGPKHQVRALIPLLFEEPIKSYHFESNKDLSAYLEKIPEESLFTDIDCYVNNFKGDLVKLYKEMSGNITSIRQQVSKSILGKK